MVAIFPIFKCANCDELVIPCTTCQLGYGYPTKEGPIFDGVMCIRCHIFWHGLSQEKIKNG